MNENVELLEELLTKMRIKYHFDNSNKKVSITLEELCVFLIKYTKLVKGEFENE